MRNPTSNGADAVVFDLGGVLIDWNPRYLYRKMFAEEATVEYFLNEICTPAWNRQLDAGVPFAEIIPPLCERFPEHADAIRAYQTRWPEMLGGEIADTVEVLKAVKAAGHSVYGLTNWSAETFPIAAERYAFLDWFDTVLVSGRVGTVKPDRSIYRRLIDETGLDPGASVFIDDTAANVEAAREAGFGVAIQFEDGASLKTALKDDGFL